LRSNLVTPDLLSWWPARGTYALIDALSASSDVLHRAISDSMGSTLHIVDVTAGKRVTTASTAGLVGCVAVFINPSPDQLSPFGEALQAGDALLVVGAGQPPPVGAVLLWLGHGMASPAMQRTAHNLAVSGKLIESLHSLFSITDPGSPRRSPPGSTAEWTSSDGGGQVVSVHPVHGRPHVHPSICSVNKDGHLIAVFNAGPSDAASGPDATVLLLSRSTDRGHTWEAATPIAVTDGRGGDRGLYPGSLTRLRSGAIVLMWSRKEDTADRVSILEYSISHDGGVVWKTPIAFPIAAPTARTTCRHALLEREDGRWVLSCGDRTLAYDPANHTISEFGDGRVHGMVPIIAVADALVSGAPAEHWSGFIEVGKTNVRPAPYVGTLAEGLRSVDGGMSWTPLRQLAAFRVCGYDLTTLSNGWVVHTVVDYLDGDDDGEVYEVGVSLRLSVDGGISFDRSRAVHVYEPRRRLLGRSWPRTVQVDSHTVGTIFYDLAMDERQASPAVLFAATPLSAFSRGKM
jgi:hypothetical protein